MKKLILILLAFTAVLSVSAQEYVIYSREATGTYNAYSIPEPIRIKYTATYGDPTLATWQPVNGWWHATYKDGTNRMVHVYYNTQPYYMVDVPGRMVDFRVSLPVTNTFVPESVVANAVARYGANLYSITRLATSDMIDAYQIGLLENGTLRTVIMNADATVANDNSDQ